MSEERAVLPKEVQPIYLVTGKVPKHTLFLSLFSLSGTSSVVAEGVVSITTVQHHPIQELISYQ